MIDDQWRSRIDIYTYRSCSTLASLTTLDASCPRLILDPQAKTRRKVDWMKEDKQQRVTLLMEQPAH